MPLVPSALKARRFNTLVSSSLWSIYQVRYKAAPNQGVFLVDDQPLDQYLDVQIPDQAL